MLTLNKGEYSGNILQLIECEGFITSKTSYEYEYNKSEHYHSNPHLSFILNGAHTESKHNQTQIKTTTDTLFYHSGELHKTISHSPKTQNLNLEFDSNFLEKFEISENQLKVAVNKNISSHLFILKFNTELTLNDSITQTSLYSLLFNFISESNGKDYKDIKWCLQLKEILNDNWNINYSLNDLSLLLKVHPITISKHFPKYFGCTLGEYIRKIRVIRSLDLIKSTDYSLSEIAYLCNFSDQSHFIRTFKHFTGFNPKSFRKL